MKKKHLPLEDYTVLLAMPGMSDPFFSRSVIAVVEQNTDGAMGFIINMSSGKTLVDVIKQVEPDKSPDEDHPILLGGPVKTDFFWVLHESGDYKFQTSIEILDGLVITSGNELLPVYLVNKEPRILGVGIGYSGWGSKQLEQEISDGSWWGTKLNVKEFFSVPIEDRWEKAFEKIGIDVHKFYDNPDNQTVN